MSEAREEGVPASTYIVHEGGEGEEGSGRGGGSHGYDTGLLGAHTVLVNSVLLYEPLHYDTIKTKTRFSKLVVVLVARRQSKQRLVARGSWKMSLFGRAYSFK